MKIMDFIDKGGDWVNDNPVKTIIIIAILIVIFKH